jgi:hypothetical protein
MKKLNLNYCKDEEPIGEDNEDIRPGKPPITH